MYVLVTILYDFSSSVSSFSGSLHSLLPSVCQANCLSVWLSQLYSTIPLHLSSLFIVLHFHSSSFIPLPSFLPSLFIPYTPYIAPLYQSRPPPHLTRPPYQTLYDRSAGEYYIIHCYWHPCGRRATRRRSAQLLIRLVVASHDEAVMCRPSTGNYRRYGN